MIKRARFNKPNQQFRINGYEMTNVVVCLQWQSMLERGLFQDMA